MTPVRFPITMASSADGWRGRLNQGFSPDNIDDLTASILGRFGEEDVTSILLSHDSRAGGVEAASRIMQVIALLCPSSRVVYLPHLPTPIASALLAEGHSDLAILVTASHNPANWNGLKVKLKPGVPLTGEDEQRINDSYQERTTAPSGTNWSAEPADISDEHLSNTAQAIAQHVQRLLVRTHIDGQTSSPLRVVVDGLNGIAGGPVAKLCVALGHEVIALGEMPLADFGGLKPDPTIPSSIFRCVEVVRKEDADIGFVLDGDGDRIIVLDHHGSAVQSQELMSALLHYAPSSLQSRLSGDVLVTTTCGQMIRAVANAKGSTLVECSVGFKHISQQLCLSPRSVGVGSVGDLGFESFTTDRDPMAVVVLTSLMLASTKAPLASLIEQLRRKHNLDHLQWVERHVQSPTFGSIDSFAEHIASSIDWKGYALETTVDGLRVRGKENQWFMVRLSTTEGGCRVYGELARASLERLLSDTEVGTPA